MENAPNLGRFAIQWQLQLDLNVLIRFRCMTGIDLRDLEATIGQLRLVAQVNSRNGEASKIAVVVGGNFVFAATIVRTVRSHKDTYVRVVHNASKTTRRHKTGQHTMRHCKAQVIDCCSFDRQLQTSTSASSDILDKDSRHARRGMNVDKTVISDCKLIRHRFSSWTRRKGSSCNRVDVNA